MNFKSETRENTRFPDVCTVANARERFMREEKCKAKTRRGPGYDNKGVRPLTNNATATG